MGALFETAFKWRNHSEFLKSVENARLSVKEAKENLLIAATVQIRNPKTIIIYTRKFEALTKFLEDRMIPNEHWSGSESVFFIGEFLRQFNETQTMSHFTKTSLKFIKTILGINWN